MKTDESYEKIPARRIIINLNKIRPFCQYIKIYKITKKELVRQTQQSLKIKDKNDISTQLTHNYYTAYPIKKWSKKYLSDRLKTDKNLIKGAACESGPPAARDYR